MEKRRRKRTEVSLRGEVYNRLKAEAAKRGMRITDLVEMILDGTAPLPRRNDADTHGHR
jgi:hypothetical protein